MALKEKSPCILLKSSIFGGHSLRKKGHSRGRTPLWAGDTKSSRRKKGPGNLNPNRSYRHLQ